MEAGWGFWRVGSGAHRGFSSKKPLLLPGSASGISWASLVEAWAAGSEGFSRARHCLVVGLSPCGASLRQGCAWCELEVACADLLRLEFEREGMGNGWGGVESQDAMLVDAAPYEATFFAACAAYNGTCHDATRARQQRERKMTPVVYHNCG